MTKATCWICGFVTSDLEEYMKHTHKDEQGNHTEGWTMGGD